VDEKWAFVDKKQAHCDPADPDDALCGDNWDHAAVDPEHRLVLQIVPGKRTLENCQELIEGVKQRTGGRTDVLITSDEHAPYVTAIQTVYGRPEPQPKRPGPGRPPKPKVVLPPDLCYATVRKTRQQGRVVKVMRTLIFGTMALLEYLLDRSTVSRTINTAFVERYNGTDRGQNRRKTRKTYGFSKDWDIHNAATFFVGYSYNFCWTVRTLRVREPDGHWQPRTPAMAAGLADHVWTLEEWLTYPARRGKSP
jgi:IS1 family transposase